jgi:hypothetical protein
MTKEQLYTLIESRYKSRRAFVLAFNEQVGASKKLDETTLSRQLSDKNPLGISAGWESAFILYFSSSYCA